MFFTKIKSIKIEELKNGNIDKKKVIDIRESSERDSGYIKGTKHIAMNQLISKPENYLQKDEKYYLMCQSGMRSKSLTKKLVKQGFNITNLKGGYKEYSKKAKGEK